MRNCLIFGFIILLVTPLFAIPFNRADSVWTMSLNEPWKFLLVDDSNKQLIDNFYKSSFNDSSFKTIPVPSNWEIMGFEEPHYYGPDSSKIGLYRKIIKLPKAWKNRQILIHFEGVSFGYTLYVNDEIVGSFEHAFLPCQFDITHLIDYDKDNTIALKVYRNHRQKFFDCNDAWALSGIYRDVYLFSPERFHIDSFKIDTKLNSNMNKATVYGTVNIRYFRNGKKLENNVPKLSIEIKLTDANGRIVNHLTQNISWLNDQYFPQHSFEIPVKKPILWSAENPYLYQLEMKLLADGKFSHNINTTIGLREVTIEDCILKINGQRVKLRGVCRHEIHPEVGRALREEHWLQDIKMMKQANINSVRCSHYPPHPRFLELCDELGLYVLDEVPIGFGEQYLQDPLMLGPMLSRAELTVSRDRNHPSVIIWDIGNENPLVINLEKTAQYVKLLDPSRPILYPGTNFPGKPNHLNSTGHSSFIDIHAKHYPSMNAISKFIKDKTIKRPHIFTELNHALDLSFGNFADKWQLIEDHDKIAGGMIWLWADQGIIRKINGRDVVDSYKNINNITKPYTLSADVWIDDNTIIDSHGQFGTDGIVYADRRPQTDYFLTKKVFSPVVIPQKQIIVKSGSGNVTFEVQNRYDFTNLSNINAQWQLMLNGKVLQHGILLIKCKPHERKKINLPLKIPQDFSRNECSLALKFKDLNGVEIYNHVIRLLADKTEPDWIQIMNKQVVSRGQISQSPDVFTFPEPLNIKVIWDEDGIFTLKNYNSRVLLEGPFVRVGRKPTMAERRTYANEKVNIWEPPVLKNAQIIERKQRTKGSTVIMDIKVRYSDNESKDLSVLADLKYTFYPQGWIDVSYSISPEYKEGVLLEFGTVWSIPGADNITWLGDGPYPAYPYKYELNERGIYSMDTKNSFFEGNRMYVDLLAAIDNSLTGIGLICNSDNVCWEKSEQNILLCHNACVASLGTKFRLPRQVLYAKDLNNTKGGFRLIILDKNAWPELFKKVLNKSF